MLHCKKCAIYGVPHLSGPGNQFPLSSSVSKRYFYCQWSCEEIFFLQTSTNRTIWNDFFTLLYYTIFWRCSWKTLIFLFHINNTYRLMNSLYTLYDKKGHFLNNRLYLFLHIVILNIWKVFSCATLCTVYKFISKILHIFLHNYYEQKHLQLYFVTITTHFQMWYILQPCIILYYFKYETKI